MSEENSAVLTPTEKGNGMEEKTVKEVKDYNIPLELIDEIEGQNHRILSDPDEDRKRTESMRREGQMQSILVRENGERFELIAGHGRLQSAKELNWPYIRARKIQCNNGEAAVLGLNENLNRRSINPIEIALGLRRAMNCNIDLEVVLEKLGHITSDGQPDMVWANNHLRLLDLEDDERVKVATGMVSKSQAFDLSRVERGLRKEILNEAEKIATEGQKKKSSKSKSKEEKQEPTEEKPDVKITGKDIDKAKKKLGVDTADKFIGIKYLHDLEDRLFEVGEEKFPEETIKALKSVINYLLGRRDRRPF